MSAPGDIVILLVLLAAFVSCAGYAAGRLHQRRQHAPDREEAYLDGYEKGTRSVFSMAARAAGRRRDRSPIAGSSPVPPKAETDEPTVPVDKPATPQAEPTRQTQVGFPAPPPHVGPGLPPPAAAGGVTYSALPDPRQTAADMVPEQREPEAREGRHTVPEELVRAATYRLPPDRVARAKVREPEESGEPTKPVPRPRGA
ncbi:hypothetical protein AB0M02_06550 [Actinoplanes sp. NPDC051861]|uniref:hypothetical protein n=1 Tax=Actinoplanes sp. NPDC051861 TaxID=3155170 RepID=UPI003434833B